MRKTLMSLILAVGVVILCALSYEVGCVETMSHTTTIFNYDNQTLRN